MTDTTTAKPSEADWKLLTDHVKRANQGCRQSLDWLRHFLDQNPQVWQHVGNLARTAESAWIALVANGDKLAAEAIKRQLQQLQAELLGETTSVIEQLVVDTVLASWLELHYLRAVDADPRQRTTGQAQTLLKRLESAQRRHFAALKQLLTLRRLLPDRPALPDLRVFAINQETG